MIQIKAHHKCNYYKQFLGRFVFKSGEQGVFFHSQYIKLVKPFLDAMSPFKNYENLIWSSGPFIVTCVSLYRWMDNGQSRQRTIKMDCTTQSCENNFLLCTYCHNYSSLYKKKHRQEWICRLRYWGSRQRKHFATFLVGTHGFSSTYNITQSSIVQYGIKKVSCLHSPPMKYFSNYATCLQQSTFSCPEQRLKTQWFCTGSFLCHNVRHALVKKCKLLLCCNCITALTVDEDFLLIVLLFTTSKMALSYCRATKSCFSLLNSNSTVFTCVFPTKLSH